MQFFVSAGIFFLLFLGLIVALCLTKEGNPVGFFGLNQAFAESNGFKPFWYNLTEVLGLFPLLLAAGFGCFGLLQWIRRKSLKSVDKDLFFLAGLYGVTAMFYVFFEIVILNYRPVLLEGEMEASFPSSHTVLGCVILGSAALQLSLRCSRKTLRILGQIFCVAYASFLTAGRLLSGVHWVTDILGGLLLSIALVLAYGGCVFLVREMEKK